MKEQPLISVILPVHNAASTLEECIFSLLSQSYKNIEIIAMDDFSKDKSYSILKNLKGKDKKLRVYRNVKRYGIAVNLNRLVRKAKGSYIAFMDTSDISSPNRLKKQLNFLLNKTLLPKDILRFNTGANPFVYSDVLIKIAPYGKFANLNNFLHFHRNNPKIYLSDVKRNLISLIKLWIKSKALYDYNVSPRSFFSPLIKSV